MDYEIQHGYRCIKRLIPTLVKIVTIEKNETCEAANWEWRKRYIGMLGSAVIITFTEGKHEGESMISLMGKHSINTSCGTLLWEDNIITLKTKNTVYVFEITGFLPAFLAGVSDMTGC